jgi:hypothetical protein
VRENLAAMETMRRWLAIAQTVKAKPWERMSSLGYEARWLREALANFGVRVKTTTAPVAHPTLVLLGLLADPPASPEAMLKRLHR